MLWTPLGCASPVKAELCTVFISTYPASHRVANSACLYHLKASGNRTRSGSHACDLCTTESTGEASSVFMDILPHRAKSPRWFVHEHGLATVVHVCFHASATRCHSQWSKKRARNTADSIHGIEDVARAIFQLSMILASKQRSARMSELLDRTLHPMYPSRFKTSRV